jgi:hypothetical protein
MSWNCAHTEDRLSEYLERALPPAEAQEMAAHLGACADCRAVVAGVQATLSALHGMDELPAPPQLADRILDATLGPRKQKVRWPGWLGWLRPVFQPRFAMGLATALLALFFTLDAVGVDWKNVELADLNPVNLYYQTNRRVHLIYARGVKYVNDLRVVYEIQSMLQPVSQQDERPQAQPPKKDKNENEKPSRESNQLKTPRLPLSVVAAVLGPGGITQ